MPIPEPVPVIRYGSAIISTAGNITMIGGQAKSGKTAVFNVWLAGHHNHSYPGQFTAHHLTILGPPSRRQDGGLVPYIDTEQSRETIRRAQAHHGTGGSHSHVLFPGSFNIRGSPQEHRQLIETVPDRSLMPIQWRSLDMVDDAGTRSVTQTMPKSPVTLYAGWRPFATYNCCHCLPSSTITPGQIRRRAHTLAKRT